MTLSIITNLGTGILTLAYALNNRFGNTRNLVKKKFPKIGKVYEKISPTIEHFCWGYTAAALGYFVQENETLKEFMINYNENVQPENFGLVAAGGVTAVDFGWELEQNIERKKFQPAQFLGTCAGALTGIAINNLEGILK